MADIKVHSKKYAEITGEIDVSTRLEFTNPFYGYYVDCKAEVFHNGEWGDTEWLNGIDSAWSGGGVKANQLGENIIIQSGNMASLVADSELTGDPFGTSGLTTPASPLKFRVHIRRLEKKPLTCECTGSSGGFTTMETISASRTWTAPKTGYYEVTCIGGGGGGGAGRIKTAFIQLTAGQTIDVIIGAGGQGGTASSTVYMGLAGEGPYSGAASKGGHVGGCGASGINAYKGSNGEFKLEALCDNGGNGGSGAVIIKY